MKRSTANLSGFTLVEVLVGAGVALIGLLAVTSLNSANLRYVKSARQTNAATLCLQERAEQMRLADWRKITDPVYLTDTLYATVPKSAAPLGSYAEKVTVSSFPDDTVAQKLVVQRKSDGSRVVLVSGSGLATQRMAKVEFQLTWKGSDGRTRTRATNTLMTNGGISRMNLPSFGGKDWETFATPTPVATPTPSGTPVAGATPTPTPATPITTPVTSKKPTRGNVGGKSGKN